MDTNTNAPSRLLRWPDLMARVGMSRAHISRMIVAGKFPKPVRLSHRVAVWTEGAIDRWIAETVAAREGV